MYGFDLGALALSRAAGAGDECGVLSACDSLVLPLEALLFAGGVNERNPSLELPLFAAGVGVDGPRASFGDMAGA